MIPSVPVVELKENHGRSCNRPVPLHTVELTIGDEAAPCPAPTRAPDHGPEPKRSSATAPRWASSSEGGPRERTPQLASSREGLHAVVVGVRGTLIAEGCMLSGAKFNPLVAIASRATHVRLARWRWRDPYATSLASLSHWDD